MVLAWRRRFITGRYRGKIGDRQQPAGSPAATVAAMARSQGMALRPQPKAAPGFGLPLAYR